MFGHKPVEAQPERPGGNAAPNDAEQEAARERQREREREASRPFHQFVYQVTKARGRINHLLRHGNIDTDPVDVNARAYQMVKDAWTRRGIWNAKWGVLPGMSWKHEQPLEEMLREEMGEEPAFRQTAPQDSGGARRPPAGPQFGSPFGTSRPQQTSLFGSSRPQQATPSAPEGREQAPGFGSARPEQNRTWGGFSYGDDGRLGHVSAAQSGLFGGPSRGHGGLFGSSRPEQTSLAHEAIPPPRPRRDLFGSAPSVEPDRDQPPDTQDASLQTPAAPTAPPELLNGSVNHQARGSPSGNPEPGDDPCPAPAERQRRSEGGSAVQNDLARTLGPVQPSKVTKARANPGARRPRTRGTPSEDPQSPPGSSIPGSPRRSRRLQGMGGNGAADAASTSADSPGPASQARPRRNGTSRLEPTASAKPQGVTKRQSGGPSRRGGKSDGRRATDNL